MIAIIDYGMGNLRSVQKGLERAGGEAVVTRDIGQIESARGVVLPGVGAFSACMQNLGNFGLIGAVIDAATGQHHGERGLGHDGPVPLLDHWRGHPAWHST